MCWFNGIPEGLGLKWDSLPNRINLPSPRSQQEISKALQYIFGTLASSALVLLLQFQGKD